MGKLAIAAPQVSLSGAFVVLALIFSLDAVCPGHYLLSTVDC